MYPCDSMRCVMPPLLVLAAACADPPLSPDADGEAPSDATADAAGAADTADAAAPDAPMPVPDSVDLPDPGIEPDVPPAPFDAGPPQDAPTPPPPPSAAEIALHFAPIWYQDTSYGGPDAQGPRADVPITADYDGDLQHDNNWENLPSTAIVPTLYWALVATETHYFLTYASYHPRDWELLCSGLLTECHEGDLEEIQVLVRRTEAGFGEIRLLRTHHHGQTTNWTLDDAVQAGQASISGAFDLESIGGEVSDSQTDTHRHPRIFAETKGHGVAPCKAGEDLVHPFGILSLSCPGKAGTDFPGGDGLRLVPSAGEPPTFEMGMEKTGTPLPYALEPMAQTLWAWRHDLGDGLMYRADDAFVYEGARGEPFGTDSAIGASFDPEQFPNDSSSGRLPWARGIPGANAGDAFLDPAWAFSKAFAVPQPWSMDYTEHAYLPSVVSGP